MFPYVDARAVGTFLWWEEMVEMFPSPRQPPAPHVPTARADASVGGNRANVPKPPAASGTACTYGIIGRERAVGTFGGRELSESSQVLYGRG